MAMSEELVDLLHMPGFRQLQAEIVKMYSDKVNLVASYAVDKPLDAIRLARGQMQGLEEVVQVLGRLEQNARKQRQGA